jgi:hypothetical protein
MTHHTDDETDEFRLTPAEERALDLELLARFVVAGGVSTIRELFDNSRPAWSLDAADRLEDRGLVELLPDKRTGVTPAGFAEHEREQERDRRRAPMPPGHYGRRGA